MINKFLLKTQAAEALDFKESETERKIKWTERER